MYGEVHKRLDKVSLWYYWGHTLAAVHHSCTDVCVNINKYISCSFISIGHNVAHVAIH
eukprot:COSAG01_NODE_951_length_12498_cov_30.544018_4_plen_58_part_00